MKEKFGGRSGGDRHPTFFFNFIFFLKVLYGQSKAFGQSFFPPEDVPQHSNVPPTGDGIVKTM